MTKHHGRHEHLRLFGSRRYLCHRCGRHGRQTRDTDPSPSSPRFRMLPDRVLLPYCTDCAPLTPQERDTAAFLSARAVVENHVPGADPIPLDRLLCTVPECGQQWPDLGVPPLVVFYDTDAMLYPHPCPWCVAESPTPIEAVHTRTVEAWLQGGHP